LARKER